MGRLQCWPRPRATPRCQSLGEPDDFFDAIRRWCLEHVVIFSSGSVSCGFAKEPISLVFEGIKCVFSVLFPMNGVVVVVNTASLAPQHARITLIVFQVLHFVCFCQWLFLYCAVVAVLGDSIRGSVAQSLGPLPVCPYWFFQDILSVQWLSRNREEIVEICSVPRAALKVLEFNKAFMLWIRLLGITYEKATTFVTGHFRGYAATMFWFYTLRCARHPPIRLL